MRKIEWSEKFAVGIESMDNEHKVLFDILGDLHEAMLNRKGVKIVVEIVDRLSDYASKHFENEENFMKANNYSGLQEQISQHRNFTRKLSEFKEEVEDDNIQWLSVIVSRFINKWMEDHICLVDTKYSHLK